MTTLRAAVIAGALACVCYLGALGNGWAMDDQSIINTNPAAHTLDEATKRFFEPYWPAESGIPAGQYRPLAIMWYAADWMVSDGSPMWFHGVNILLHGLATVLLVFVVAKWLPPAGSLVAGVVFAIHPVHVEAVANVVGRSEVATAAALLGAMLCARQYRSTTGGKRSAWLGGVLTLLLASLFIKENAIVLIALLALDEVTDGEPRSFVQNASLYVGVATVMMGWLFLWQGVAREFVSTSENAALRDAGHYERLSTMFPAYLHVLRLLTWPMELAPDYNPQMIARRTAWSVLATFGLVQVGALLGLAWVLRRKALAIAVAIVASFIVYSPTSNLFFSSGVVLAERNLYLAVWAPAVVAGWLVCHVPHRYRVALLAGLGAVGFAFLARTVQRVPDWESTEQILTDAFAENSENFRGHLRIGSLLFTAEDYSGAFAQAMAAGEIFPDDPFVSLVTTPLAFDLGYDDLALSEAERGYALARDYPQMVQLVARARLRTGDVPLATSGARAGIAGQPTSPMNAQTYIEILEATDAAPWRRAFAQARDDWIHGRLGMATRNLRTGALALADREPADQNCWDLEHALPLLDALTPPEAGLVRNRIRDLRDCGGESGA